MRMLDGPQAGQGSNGFRGWNKLKPFQQVVGHRIYTYIANSLVISMFFGMRPCLSIPKLLDACSYGTHVIVMYTKPLMQTRASEPDLKLRRVHTCMHVRMGTCKHTYLHKLHACMHASMHSTYSTCVHTYVHTCTVCMYAAAATSHLHLRSRHSQQLHVCLQVGAGN